MANNLTSITNVSKQVVPILIDAISLATANSASDLAPSRAEQMGIAPGAEVELETSRIDIGQLEQLQRLGLLTFISR